MSNTPPEPTNDATPAPAPSEPNQAAKPNGPDGFPEATPQSDMSPDQVIAYWKHKARKHEDAANANADKARRLDELENANASEIEKATKRAEKAEADAAATAAELAIARAAVKHGLSGDDLDLLGAHGSAEEIDARAEKLAARIKAAADSKPKPDFGGGDRGEDVGSKAGQLTADDMKRMSPEEIVKADSEGRFDGILNPS